MQLLFICPYWGQEGTVSNHFFLRLQEEQYHGVEINLPHEAGFIKEFHAVLNTLRKSKNDFTFIAQQVLSPADETVDEYLARMNARLTFLASQKPDFINSHTGKDYFSFDDNCRIIEAAENIAVRSGVPILHEIHRGRFTFHAYSLLPYLEQFPNMKLTGDFSHWTTVSESLLQDQEYILKKIIPHVHHIHARVGYEQGPQVNDPFAPEWSQHVETFCHWWSQIIATQSARGKKSITITPEFGPAPYMPALPYSRKPLADQWLVNVQIKNLLGNRLASAHLKK
ncbi:MAG: sugar phosphate isomerase/epimerase [Bacteroidetes bacterium]|nr:sugar phosphate isomerase/epimerase [Bacteroidota bacterium]MBS1540410.1 sugar phosphate isomerase/epimerase [Bacteroidota bacterium]